MDNLSTLTNNVVNILSILGSDTTIKSLRYQAIDKQRIWTSGYMSPGMFNMGQILLTTQESLLAKSLSTNDNHSILSLSYLYPETEKNYIGILSGTIAPIKTIYPEIFNNIKINENKTENKNINGFKIKIFKIDINHEQIINISKDYKRNIGIFATILNIGFVIYCFILKDYYISFLILINVIISYILGYYFFTTKIKFTKKKITDNCPPGDVFIEIDRTFLLIKGKEDHIQSLLQLPMKAEDNQIIGITVGILCIILGILNVIIIPLGSTTGQAMVALLLLIGYITNAFFAIFDKEIIYNQLGKTCVHHSYIEEINLDNRTEALGFLFELYDFDVNAVINCENIIPKSITWKQWYNNCINNEFFKEPLDKKLIDNNLLSKLENNRNIGIKKAKKYKLNLNNDDNILQELEIITN